MFVLQLKRERENAAKNKETKLKDNKLKEIKEKQKKERILKKQKIDEWRKAKELQKQKLIDIENDKKIKMERIRRQKIKERIIEQKKLLKQMEINKKINELNNKITKQTKSKREKGYKIKEINDELLNKFMTKDKIIIEKRKKLIFNKKINQERRILKEKYLKQISKEKYSDIKRDKNRLNGITKAYALKKVNKNDLIINKKDKQKNGNKFNDKKLNVTIFSGNTRSVPVWRQGL